MSNITNETTPVIVYDDCYQITCPYCNITIMVMKNELNCKIFRCGQYKLNGKQIDPHLSEQLCNSLIQKNLIYGCSKPFIFKNTHVEKCGYI